MTKRITITIENEFDENGKAHVMTRLDSENIDSFELLGILTYFQKSTFIQIAQNSDTTTNYPHIKD